MFLSWKWHSKNLLSYKLDLLGSSNHILKLAIVKESHCKGLAEGGQITEQTAPFQLAGLGSVWEISSEMI